MSVTSQPWSAGSATALVALPARSPSEQLRLLLRLSETLAGVRTVREVSVAVTSVATSFFGAMFGGVAVVEPNGVDMCYLDLMTLPETVRQFQCFPVASARPAAVALRENRAILIESVTAAQDLDPVAAEAAAASGGQAVAYVPMRLGLRAVGSIALMWSEPIAFSDEDKTMFSALAGYAAQALDRAQLLDNRQQVARVLQEAMLPVLPAREWVEIAATYQPANVDDAVGGDWYDAFGTTASRVKNAPLTVVVGDVTGHDTQAAAYMGRIQAKLRALALDAPASPSELLARLERVMEVSAHHRLVTGIVAELVPSASGEVDFVWCNAGHPPPLLLSPGRPARYLTASPQLLLGLNLGTARTDSRVCLPAGSTLLLFTDGLFERRAEDLDVSLERLRLTVQQHRGLPLRQLVTTVVEQQTAGNDDDDAVLLGLTVHPDQSEATVPFRADGQRD